MDAVVRVAPGSRGPLDLGVAAVGRAVRPHGRGFLPGAPMKRNEYKQKEASDRWGRHAFCTIFGEQVHARRVDDIAVQFQYNVATMDITTTVDAQPYGAVAIDASRLKLTTGANAAGTAKAVSKNWVRYRPGHEGFAFFTAGWPVPPTHANGYSRIGPFDANDGFGVGYVGTSFGVFRRRATSDTFVAQADFNLDTLGADPRRNPSGFVLRKDFVNIFAVHWGFLGVAPIFFSVYGGPGVGWVPFHVLETHNTGVVVNVRNPVLPITAEVANGNTTNVQLLTASWNGGTAGQFEACEAGSRVFTAGNVEAGITTVNSVLGIQSQATWQSLPSKIISRALGLGVRVDGAVEVTIRVHKNATVTAADYATDVDATNSVHKYDTAGTAVSGGSVLFSAGVPGNSGAFFDLINQGIKWYPGDTIHVSATSGGAPVQVDVDFRWVELF